MFFCFLLFFSSLLKDHVFHNGFSELSRYKLASAYNDDSKQSDQRLSFSAEETLDPWLPKMRLSKTDQSAQTRICAGWSESFAVYRLIWKSMRLIHRYIYIFDKKFVDWGVNNQNMKICMATTEVYFPVFLFKIVGMATTETVPLRRFPGSPMTSIFVLECFSSIQLRYYSFSVAMINSRYNIDIYRKKMYWQSPRETALRVVPTNNHI